MIVKPLLKLYREIRFRKIEKRVDSLLISNRLLQNRRSLLCSFFIMSNELLRRVGNLTAPDNPIFHNPLLTSLTLGKALTIILKYGKYSNSNNDLYIYKTKDDFEYINSKLIQDFDALFAFYTNSLFYYQFEIHSKLYSRGYSDIRVNKNAIDFFQTADGIFQITALEEMVLKPMRFHLIEARYNALVSSYSDDQKVNSIINSLSKWTKIYFPFIDHDVLSRDLFTRSVFLAKAYLNTLQDINIDWAFPNYSLSDAREFWLYIQSKCSLLHALDILFCQHPKYPLFYVQKSGDWIEELSEGTGLPKAPITAILNDMSFDVQNPNLGIQVQPFIEISREIGRAHV